MNRNHKPELTTHRAARVVCALAAAAVTWAQFSGVVSLAGEPPMAMAGYRGTEVLAKQAGSAKYALAPIKESSVASR